MMKKHTPEPWFAVDVRSEHPRTLVYVCVHGANGNAVAGAYEKTESSSANARRIVACVNACAGVTTKELEALDASDIVLALALNGEK